jgi:hypothetical protein
MDAKLGLRSPMKVNPRQAERPTWRGSGHFLPDCADDRLVKRTMSLRANTYLLEPVPQRPGAAARRARHASRRLPSPTRTRLSHAHAVRRIVHECRAVGSQIDGGLRNSPQTREPSGRIRRRAGQSLTERTLHVALLDRLRKERHVVKSRGNAGRSIALSDDEISRSQDLLSSVSLNPIIDMGLSRRRWLRDAIALPPEKRSAR